jgi:hypothetical protein
MTHYASCGHEIIDDEYTALATKTIACAEEGYVNSVLYGTYCPDCAKELEASGDVLYNEQEEMEWLSTDTAVKIHHQPH